MAFSLDCLPDNNKEQHEFVTTTHRKPKEFQYLTSHAHGNECGEQRGPDLWHSEAKQTQSRRTSHSTSSDHVEPEYVADDAGLDELTDDGGPGRGRRHV